MQSEIGSSVAFGRRVPKEPAGAEKRTLTGEDLRPVEDAVVAGVRHEHVGRVVLGGRGLVPPQGDFVAALDDVHLVDGRPHGSLHLGDLVVVGVRLPKDKQTDE